jgi:hypothetical protein
MSNSVSAGGIVVLQQGKAKQQRQNQSLDRRRSRHDNH